MKYSFDACKFSIIKKQLKNDAQFMMKLLRQILLPTQWVMEER